MLISECIAVLWPFAVSFPPELSITSFLWLREEVNYLRNIIKYLGQDRKDSGTKLM